MKIKAVILDIDGVIVGEKIGFNTPHPHPDVIAALKKIRSKGIFISLCSGKPHFAIKSIIDSAGLNNLHITQGGAVIINPINNLIHPHPIEKEIAIKLIDTCLKNNIYTELYTVDNYIIQKNQECEITKKHTHILQREPQKIDSLMQASESSQITRIMPIAKDEEDKKNASELFHPFEKDLVFSWGLHPIALPLQFCSITANGISKQSGAKEIIKNLNIPFDEVFGVGDTTSDWQFIELCQYGATLSNGSDKLKELVLSKGNDFSHIGPDVDENGILEVFEHFNLIEK